MESKPLVIGLAGFGTVGSGLCEILKSNSDIIERRSGRKIAVKTILVRNPSKKRHCPIPENVRLTTDMTDLVDDPEIDAVVELIGGITAAADLVERALTSGKHVVTANKALLAEDGDRLFAIAERENRILRYEASVAGAIPIVSTLKDSLNGNRVKSLLGILNGTSNYILSEMTTNGLEFDVALRQAQDQGFAEADPSLDIDGHDAAHKLIVLIRLAFGASYPFASLSVQGIRNLSSMDIRLAREFGYRIKLVGQVKAIDGGNGKIRLAAGVFPALVPHIFLLARVGGAYNALRVEANAAGPLFFHGKGAGSLPTAGAVLSDLMAVARDERPNNTGFARNPIPAADIMPASDWPSCFYARVMVDDAPGVLRDISGCMATENISVAQMIQKAETGESGVPLVFMTHETTSRAMAISMERARNAGLLREAPVFFRALEKEIS